MHYISRLLQRPPVSDMCATFLLNVSRERFWRDRRVQDGRGDGAFILSSAPIASNTKTNVAARILILYIKKLVSLTL